MITQFELCQLIQKSKIKMITFNSKKVNPNTVFIAIKGKNTDGNKFIYEAINKGASFIISDANPNEHNLLPLSTKKKILYVKNARIALSYCSDLIYKKRPKYLLGVTGTNGKTSVVSYCYQLLKLLGKNSASIGTLGVNSFPFIKQVKTDEELTTLDPISLKIIFELLSKNKIKYAAFEASSHGIEQERINGIKVQAAAFTSFSHEHLDYHINVESYLFTKLKLFSNNLERNGFAIINSEINELNIICNFLKNYPINVITVGNNGTIKVTVQQSDCYHQTILVQIKARKYYFKTKILGAFQANNLVIAAMLVSKLGFSLKKVISLLEKVQGVNGRMERVTEINYPFQVFVDYGHNPEALKKSLLALKQIINFNGKIKVIFGCGGNRDQSKRNLMGKIASNLADEVIITDDNPRFENPNIIRQQIMAGCDFKNCNIIQIANREEAIIHGVNYLKKDDILIIFGKGHEEYQIIGNKKIPFSDVEVVKLAIKKKL